ncbi:MAG: Histidine kinase, gyrase and HSP90-like ATPase [Acidimicrobiales bacterium]|nr:Histidine kinase, gyrase and HSP90-like ATPase [Acidimicrobiales bacterium]
MVREPRGGRRALDRPRRDRRGWGIVATPILQFVLAGAAALLILALALSVASRRVGEREAIVDARSQALVKAQGLVEPTLSDGLLRGDPKAVAALDKVVLRDVLSASLVRVKIWREDGTVLYSDEHRLLGQRFQLGEDDLRALHSAQVQADVSDLRAPENRFEQHQGKLLQVYLPLRTPGHTAVLFEAYFRYQTVESAGRRIWRSFAPFTLGSLVVLELVQIPLAWGLARRLRTRQLEREDLLNRAIDASERERRRIAQDLHDGVVQDLAGVSYSLGAISRQERPPTADEVDSAGHTVRASIEALRTLLVEIYPPNLAEEGLGPALDDLLSRPSAVGLVTDLDTTGLAPDVPLPAARLVYRTVQESMRNVVSHAGATSVTVRAGSDAGQVWAEVVDDGRGFDAESIRGRAGEGHVGLAGLADLAEEAGAQLTVRSAEGHGTTVRVEVPWT